MIKKLSFIALVLAFSVQSLAQTTLEPWNTEGQIPTPQSREEVAQLKQQISEIQANLTVAQKQLRSADRQRDIATYVVLPIAAAAAILAGRQVIKGDPKGAWAIFFKPSADSSFAVKLSSFLAKASVIGLGVDFVYIRFLTHNQIQSAELKVNFLQVQLQKLNEALNAVDQSLVNESEASSELEQALP